MDERRSTDGAVSLRVDGARRRIVGYGAVFNRLSKDLGGFVERVAPGAFDRSRAEGWPDVLARYMHDDLRLLGTTGAGTLELRVDRVGLHYAVDPPRSREDVVELVARGDVRRSSFAFRVHPGGDDWQLGGDGYPLRTLLAVQLVDVAPVNLPAYGDSPAALESLADYVGAGPAEVSSYAAAGRLDKMLHRTAGPRRLTGRQALVQLLGRKFDPSLT